MTTMEKSAAQKKTGAFSKLKNFRELNLIIIIAAICVIMSFLSPVFATATNIRAVAISLALDFIVVTAMALVIISGGIDLSVGATMGVACAITAVMYTGGSPFIVCVVCGFGVAVLMGFFNGFLIAKQKMPPFIVTLAAMSIARGLCFIVTQGYSISLTNKLPAGFKILGSGEVGGIPVLVIISIAFIIFADIMFRRSPVLRKVFYTGSNEKTAAYSGIPVSKIKISVYVVSAALCGLAGILFLARFSYASAIVGQGIEMSMIAGCVIGGVSMEGGEGSVLGAVLGVTMLALINNALVLLNISVYWQEFISGVILITAVWLDYYRNSRRQKALVKA